MNWYNTTGGPFLICPAELVGRWRGILDWFPEEDARAPGVVPSDYARACLVDDYVETIAIGDGSALVLGDVPCSTTYLPGGDGGTFARWEWAEDEASVARALGTVPETLWQPTPCQIDVGTGGLILFDSASPGESILPASDGPAGDWLGIDVAPGRYAVETAHHRPDQATYLLLHRLRRV